MVDQNDAFDCLCQLLRRQWQLINSEQVAVSWRHLHIVQCQLVLWPQVQCILRRLQQCNRLCWMRVITTITTAFAPLLCLVDRVQVGEVVGPGESGGHAVQICSAASCQSLLRPAPLHPLHLALTTSFVAHHNDPFGCIPIAHAIDKVPLGRL